MTNDTVANDSQSADQASEPAPAIDSRFLFVDVAAQRANQLRRGARIRLTAADGRHLPHKLERAAMEEVRQQLVQYTVPETPAPK
jgi:DNA-directed RNA polymerase subunit K/omega